MMRLLGPETSTEVKIAIIIAMVEACKELAGDNSKMKIIAAIVFGVMIQLGVVATEQVPVLAPWIDGIFSGLILGLSAAGFYRLGKRGGTAIVYSISAALAGYVPPSLLKKKPE